MIASLIAATIVSLGHTGAASAHAWATGQTTLQLPSDSPSRLEVPIELNGQSVTLDLTARLIRARSFELLEAHGGTLRSIAPPPSRTYLGQISQLPGSSAAASLVDGRLSATIRLADGETFVVEPLHRNAPGTVGSPSLVHVIYRGADLPGTQCRMSPHQRHPRAGSPATR